MNYMQDEEGLNVNDGNSSHPTEGFDSDAMLDPPNEQVGDTKDVTYDGKAKKEILEVGEGVKRPKNNFLCTISYKSYFFDHAPIEEMESVQLSVGDQAYPRGLSECLKQMRLNEKAKLKLQKKLAFGGKDPEHRLKFPSGFEDPETEQGKKIREKGVIYEVKLLSFVERIDLDGEGGSAKFLKRFINKASQNEWEKPSDMDEIRVNLRAYVTEDKVLLEKKDWDLKMNDNQIPITFSKIFQSLKRGELSVTEVSAAAYQLDALLLSDVLPSLTEYNDCPALHVETELVSLIKVEDWFKDGGSALKRVLRKGKSGQPNTESTVKMRMRILINDKEVLNNFSPEALQDISQAYNLKDLTDEQKTAIQNDESLYTFTLDEYNLPSLLIKVIKSMRRNEVSEFRVDPQHIQKLQNNFQGKYFDQYKVFKEGDRVQFFLYLADTSKDFYFYQLTVAEKLQRVLYLKNIAGNFFKQQNFRKAAKIYQKINGYFNFGDATNNHAKEDENSEEFQKTQKELLDLKIVSFNNLVVCKYKLKEYQSIVGITDQIIDMDPNNVKALYFRGKAFIEIQEYSQAVDCLQKLVQVDPNHVDGRNELIRAKKIKKDFLDAEHKKYSKFFS